MKRLVRHKLFQGFLGCVSTIVSSLEWRSPGLDWKAITRDESFRQVSWWSDIVASFDYQFMVIYTINKQKRRYCRTWVSSLSSVQCPFSHTFFLMKFYNFLPGFNCTIYFFHLCKYPLFAQLSCFIFGNLHFNFRFWIVFTSSCKMINLYE